MCHDHLTSCCFSSNKKQKKIPTYVKETFEESMMNLGIAPSSFFAINNRSNSATCSKCALSIKDHYVIKALDSFWHEHCLCCSMCGGNLCQLGSSLYVKQGSIFCKNDYLRLFGPTGQCAGCQNQIFGNELVIRKDPQTIYHLNCFSCTNCKRTFGTGERCMTDSATGKIYCLENSCRLQIGKEKKVKKQKKFKDT